MARGQLIADKNESNHSVFDGWSFVHAAVGVAAAASGMSAWTYAFLCVGYEVVEYMHEYPKGSKIFGSKEPEWELNVAADLALGLGAFALTAFAAGRRPPPAPY